MTNITWDFFNSKSEFDVEIFGDLRMPVLRRQLESFYKADAIFAPHGAGLSNLLATRKSVVVVELLERPVWDVYVVTVVIASSVANVSSDFLSSSTWRGRFRFAHILVFNRKALGREPRSCKSSILW